MKILFIVTASFPTAKAYGVTTRETMTAAKNLEHEVYSLSLKSNYSDSDYDEIYSSLKYLRVNKTINYLKNISFRSTNYFSKAAWIIMQNLLLRFNYKEIDEKSIGEGKIDFIGTYGVVYKVRDVKTDEILA